MRVPSQHILDASIEVMFNFRSSWEEADLTDRLITALEMHDRWSGVFTSTASAEHSRSLIGVPKRDLQREIARYLFRDDPRYDLEDKRTVEALAVSVKNKLFK